MVIARDQVDTLAATFDSSYIDAVKARAGHEADEILFHPLSMPREFGCSRETGKKFNRRRRMRGWLAHIEGAEPYRFLATDVPFPRAWPEKQQLPVGFFGICQSSACATSVVLTVSSRLSNGCVAALKSARSLLSICTG